MAAKFEMISFSSVTSDQVDQLMRNVNERLESSSHQTTQDIEAEDNDPTNYHIGIIPPKTQDRNKMISATDHRNFKALCRGLELLPKEKAKNLKCYYYLRKEEDPYFLLQPLKVL